jgi:hypothetical protein
LQHVAAIIMANHSPLVPHLTQRQSDASEPQTAALRTFHHMTHYARVVSRLNINIISCSKMLLSSGQATQIVPQNSLKGNLKRPDRKQQHCAPSTT